VYSGDSKLCLISIETRRWLWCRHCDCYSNNQQLQQHLSSTCHRNTLSQQTRRYSRGAYSDQFSHPHIYTSFSLDNEHLKILSNL